MGEYNPGPTLSLKSHQLSAHYCAFAGFLDVGCSIYSHMTFSHESCDHDDESCDCYLGNRIGPLSMSVLGAVEKFLTQKTMLNQGTEYTSRHPSSRQITHQSVTGGGVLSSSSIGGAVSMALLKAKFKGEM